MEEIQELVLIVVVLVDLDYHILYQEHPNFMLVEVVEVHILLDHLLQVDLVVLELVGMEVV